MSWLRTAACRSPFESSRVCCGTEFSLTLRLRRYPMGKASMILGARSRPDSGGVACVNVKYRYLYEDVDRHGNVRIYFWRGKGHRKVRLREKVGSPEFHREYQALAAATRPDDLSEAKPKSPTPNTFRWLCVKFFDSTDFKLLDHKTQHVRRQVLEHTWDEPIAPGATEKFGDFPLSRMTAKAVRVLRNREQCDTAGLKHLLGAWPAQSRREHRG
jgi:hypothetical protein